MRNFLDIVILAAGEGRRMRSSLPKTLQPLGGRPLIFHVMESANALSPRAIYIVVGDGESPVKAAVGEKNPRVHWVVQKRRLGTLHSLKSALPKIKSGGATLVLLGDSPLMRASSLKKMARAAQRGAIAIAVADSPNPYGYGRIVRDSCGKICAVMEEKQLTSSQKKIAEINAGALAAPTDWILRRRNKVRPHSATGEYYLPALIEVAEKDGMPIIGIPLAEFAEAMGVNTPLDLAAAEREYQRRESIRLLESGARLADSSRLIVRGKVKCARDVFIDANVILDNSILGEGAVVGANCVIINSRIGGHSVIESFSHLDNCIVGANARIGPFARLRPGAKIGGGGRIGNFVEIKNATLGKGSRANHLAYIGDAVVGDRVNIGAGAITCNYDGKLKHQTKIGDDAFIGSGAQLVAPVKIGGGVMVAAGSTVTEDAPPNSLVIARARQMIKKNYRATECTEDKKGKKNKKDKKDKKGKK